MSLTICAERPDTADAVALIDELQTHLESFYPPESRHGFSVERMVAEGVAFFVLRVDGEAAGCGGILLVRQEETCGRGGCGVGRPAHNRPAHNEEYGELKRMFVRPRFRGGGFGKMILDRLAEHAREHGVTLLRLETGIHQEAAIRLYERHGFQRIGPFGAYTGNPMNLFFEKRVGSPLS
jgi:putative acetyltransferase